MYQSVGHHAVDMYAEAMGLPLYRRTITGSALITDKDYTKHPGDEVEDLFLLLQDIQVLLLITRLPKLSIAFWTIILSNIIIHHYSACTLSVRSSACYH